MATKPTKPTVPPAPLRSEPSTYSDRMEASLVFWQTDADYRSDSNDFVDTRADEALAAALGGDLPALTGKAGQLLRVNAGEDAAEFTNAIDDVTIGQTTPAAVDSNDLTRNGSPVPSVAEGTSIYATVGGTANAITLTTGLSLTVIPTGLEVRFRAGAVNTGATTINIDSIGTVAAKIVTGEDPWSGCIRDDVDTLARYDGTNWIVSSAVESGIELLDVRVLSNDSEADFDLRNDVYSSHEFVFENVIPADDAVQIGLRTSTGGDPTFDDGSAHYIGARHDIIGGGGGAFSSSYFPLTTNVGSGAGEDGVSGSVMLYGVKLVKKTQIRSSMVFEDSSGAMDSRWSIGRRDSAAEVDAVRFLVAGGGDLESGTIRHYGYR